MKHAKVLHGCSLSREDNEKESVYIQRGHVKHVFNMSNRLASNGL